jgi:hypothetical protein
MRIHGLQRDAFRRMLKGECVGREADIKTLTDQLHAERARVIVLERSASMYLASPTVINPGSSPTNTYTSEMGLALGIAASSVPSAVAQVPCSFNKDMSSLCIHSANNNTAARASVSPALNSFGSRTMTSVEASPQPQLQSNVTASGIQTSDGSALSRNAAVARVDSSGWRPTSASAAAGIPPVNIFGGHHDKSNVRANLHSTEGAMTGSDPKGAGACDDVACNDVGLLNQMLAEARGRITLLEQSVSRNQVAAYMHMSFKCSA